MSKALTPTAVTTAPGLPTTPPPAETMPEPAAARRGANPLKKVLAVIGSLRLTVVLFALCMILVFCGTLAQKDAGIHTIVKNYFRSPLVWIQFKIFFATPKPPDTPVPGVFPFPGGWTLGTLLLINLLTAHALRFRFYWQDVLLLAGFVGGLLILFRYETYATDWPFLWGGIAALAVTTACTVPVHWKRSGVLIAHAGIILLMGGELITGVYAVESNLTVLEGATTDYLEEQDYTELAFVDRSDPKFDKNIVIPENVLKKGGRITHADLPFDVEVVEYMVNSELIDLTGKEPNNRASAGDGKAFKAVAKKVNSGADSEGSRDIASAYIRLVDKKTGQPLDTYLASIFLSILPNRAEQTVQAGDKTYGLSLRFKRVYKPYSVSLLKFNSDYYPGTDIPRNYSSLVRFQDPSHGVDNNVTIWMNHPLRYRGETFFQAGWTRHAKGTILQVVRNPGWLLPYVSCAVVGTGLLVHFGIYLVNFLRQRRVS